MGRLSSSGIGMDALRGVGAGEVLVDLRSGGVDDLSPLWDDRLDLCLDFSLDLGVSEVLSLSLSFTFEGMVRGGERCEGVGGWVEEGGRWGGMVSGLSEM